MNSEKQILLKMHINRITDDTSYPGWCEATFSDASGEKIAIIDKIPVLFNGDIESMEKELIKGYIEVNIPCLLIKDEGEQLIIDIGEPYSLSDISNTSIFVVKRSDLIL